MKKTILSIVGAIDIILVPFIIPSAATMWLTRRIGLQKLPFSRKAMLKIRLLPMIDHYYEPLINPKYLRFSLKKKKLIWN